MTRTIARLGRITLFLLALSVIALVIYALLNRDAMIFETLQGLCGDAQARLILAGASPEHVCPKFQHMSELELGIRAVFTIFN